MDTPVYAHVDARAVHKRVRVLVAMSGGVDSSVAAALLKEQGYEVIGMTFRLWSGDDGRPFERSCCSVDSVEDARRVAQILGIPHYVLNFKEYFERTVIADFVSEYARGRTPNPCVRCNEFIKYNAFQRKAKELDADLVATGHYARIVRDGHYRLLRAKDSSKDQSYVLYVVTQEQLAHTLLPLGDYEKQETRALARRFGLPVAEKPDSQEVCFVGDGDYVSFLLRYRPELERPGEIVDEHGRLLGEHRGIIHYTVGQRRGLGISKPIGEPLYVLRIDAEGNRITVGTRDALEVRWAWLERVNWICGVPPCERVRASVKYRYRSREADAWVYPRSESTAEVLFDEPQIALALGQAAVFYRGDEVVGGGTIARTEKALEV